MQIPTAVDAHKNGGKAVPKSRTEFNQKNRIPVEVVLLNDPQPDKQRGWSLNMAIWTEEVSNEGHVYAALDDDLGSFNFWLTFEDELREMFSDAAEELAMEEGQ